MNDNDFDQRLKNALDGLDVPYDPSTWDALDKRLDALPPPAPVDDTVGPALAHLEVPYEPAHWTALAERLDRHRRLRWQLWGAKLTEAALLLLLLLQFGALTERRPSRTAPAARPAPAKGISPAQGPVAARQADPARPAAGPVAAAPSQTPDAAVSLNAAAEPNAAFWPAWFPAGTANWPATGRHGHVPSIPLLLESGLENATPGSLAWLSPLPDRLAGLPLASTAILDFSMPLIPAPVMPAGNLPAKAKPYYAGAYAAAEQNRIRTDGDDITRAARGYGAGVLAGYRRGAWRVEAGFGYAHRGYEPKREIEIYDGTLAQGYWGSAITKVDADVLTAPVRVLRQVARIGRTSALVIAGGTGQVALQRDYHYRSVYYPGTNPGNPSDPYPAPQLPTTVPENRAVGRGVAEGGKLAANLSATVDAGLRIEQNLGHRLTAYVESTYRHAVAGNGVGPKASKVNSVGVQLGVLAQL